MDENDKLVQFAQICANCKKIVAFNRKTAQKVIHRKSPENTEKMSYAQTYSLYPQKKQGFLLGQKHKNRTTVL